MAGPIRSTTTHLDDQGRTVYTHEFRGQRKIRRVFETVGTGDPPVARAAKGKIWRGGVDTRAVRRACLELGITMPVVLVRSGGTRRRGAAKQYSDNRPYHTITVSTYSSVHHASGVLWHELTHCAQIERIMAEDRCNIYTAGCRLQRENNADYANSPYEREAERNRASHLHTYLTTDRRMTGGIIYAGKEDR